MTTESHGAKANTETETLYGYNETPFDIDAHTEQTASVAEQSNEVMQTPEEAKTEVNEVVNTFVAETPGLVDKTIGEIVGQPPPPESEPLVRAAAAGTNLQENLTDIAKQAEDVRRTALADIDSLPHAEAMKALEQQYQNTSSKNERDEIEKKMEEIDVKHGIVAPVEQFTSSPKPVPAVESTYARMKNLETKLKSGNLLPGERDQIEAELVSLDKNRVSDAPAVRTAPAPTPTSAAETAPAPTEATKPVPEIAKEPGTAKVESGLDPEILIKNAESNVKIAREAYAKLTKEAIASGAAKDIEEAYFKAVDAYGKARYAADKDAVRKEFDERAVKARGEIENLTMDGKTKKLDLRFKETRYKELLDQVDRLKVLETEFSKKEGTNDADPVALANARELLKEANTKIDNELRLDAQNEFVLKERQEFLGLKSAQTEAGKSKNRKRLDKVWNAYQKQPRWVKMAAGLGVSAVVGAATPGMTVGLWALARGGGMVGGMIGGKIGGWLGGLAGGRMSRGAREQAATATAMQDAAIRDKEDLGAALQSSLESHAAERKAKNIERMWKIGGTLFGAVGGGIAGSQIAQGFDHQEVKAETGAHPKPAADTSATGTETAPAATGVKIHAEESMFGSRGAIGGFDDLQEKLKIQFGEDSTKWTRLPENVKHLLETDPHTLAQEYGMYNPNSTAESAMVMKGDSLMLDENGHVLLKDHTGTVQDLTTAGKANVKMFDYETTFKQPIGNSADAKLEAASVAARDQMLNQEQALNDRYHMSEIASERATARLNDTLNTDSRTDSVRLASEMTMEQKNVNADNIFTKNVNGNPGLHTLGDSRVKFVVGNDGRATGIESLVVGPNQNTDVSYYLGNNWEDNIERSGRLFGPSLTKQARVIEETIKNIDSVRKFADQFPVDSQEHTIMVYKAQTMLGELSAKYPWNKGLWSNAVPVLNKN